MSGALEEVAHQVEQIAIEQYTANLIAFYAIVPTEELKEQIKERLGL